MIADERHFYMKESQSPFANEVETVYLLKLKDSWVTRHVVLTDQGELIEWSQSLYRCPHCKGIVEVGEEDGEYCYHCQEEFDL